ncbi:phosphatases II [Trametopsis cervina]|nr:phosphatases II [Trametopsis cervina]
MTDFVRRFVSGNKARFRDEDLDLELDLAYITDHVIVMGYPSKGVEGFYRNRREDAKKFLEHRHGKNFWVFNFCPVKENSYPASFFDGRVSRYPFPDHHAPPLAILPLIAREMRIWLDGSPDRVAVLHCKAGKGRSGTMACSYLLTLSDAPTPPAIGRSRKAQEAAKKHAEELMNIMPPDIDADPHTTPPSEVTSSSDDPIKSEIVDGGDTSTSVPEIRKDTKTNTLQHVLELHTAGRMKRPSSPSNKVKLGVSIPSQRRWLYYWSLLIAHQGPPGLWSLNTEERTPAPKVRLTQITLRMTELSALKANLVKAASALMERTGKGKANGSSHLWISLARYDDELVETLERWERTTRTENEDMGLRKKGSEHSGDDDISQLFASNKWDKGKMVRTFARLGTAVKDDVTKELSNKEGKILAYTMRPLSQDTWNSLRTEIEEEGNRTPAQETTSDPEETSLHDITAKIDASEGVILDANREVRVKLYMGQVFLGWFWFIPTFHMKHPRSSADDASVNLRLTRAEIDFPLGIGAHIVDVEVSMKWCPDDVVNPPDRQNSADSDKGKSDPPGLATALQAAVSGKASEAMEASQAGDD